MFYVLRNPNLLHPEEQIAATDWISENPVILGDAPKCGECGDYLASLPWLPPHKCELEVWSNRYGDISFGTGSELLLSRRFLDLYTLAGLTGLRISGTAEITRVIARESACPAEEIPEYHVARVLQSSAKLDYKASGMEHDKPYRCDACRSGNILRFSKVVIEDGTWSGEDLFIAQGLPGTIMTSLKFKQFFDANTVNNGILVPASEHSWAAYGKNNFR